jgi:oligoribonuclease
MKHTLFWLDLEMTGLNPEKDVILQCAALVSNNVLEQVADGIEYSIHQQPELLQIMDPFVAKMHTKSGLLEKVQQSTHSMSQVEKYLIAFFKQHCIPGETLLCGNSIWVDRSFLKKQMPEFESLFYYRMIDVSTIKELAIRWYPSIPIFKKQKKHTALADIQESINELAYYKQHIFIP